MKFILFISFLISTNAYSQKADSIIGKWKYQEVYKKDGLDSLSISMFKEMFGDVSFYFKKNMHYKLFMMGSIEEGTWEYNPLKNKIILASNKGNGTSLKILNLTNNTLAISIGEPNFILRRTPATAEDEIEEPIKKIATVSATLAQLSKKWYFKKREVPNKTEAQIKVMSDLAKGSFYFFKPSYEYDAQVFKLTESGKWFFGAENKSIIIGDADKTKVWNIKSISSTELILVKGNSEDVWIFSTTK